MGFFLPIRNWVLQTLTFLPVSTKQNFTAVYRRFISTTLYRWAESIDSKAFHPEMKIKDSSMMKKKTGKNRFPPKPFSAFAAGSSKMRAICNTNNAVANDSSSPLNIVSPPDTPLSAKEWEKLKEEYQHLKKFENVMFESMIANHSPIDVAKSLLVAMAKRDGDIEYNYLVMYLTICVFHKDTEEIYDIYNIMKAKYKSLEASAYSLLIKGLSDSPHWKETLVLLEKVKKVSFHSKQNYGDCIEGALLNQERNLAFELFHEMVAENLTPALTTIKLFFDFCQPVKDDDLKNKCTDILYYLRNHQIYPDESLMLSIKQWFESIPGENWKGNLTSMNNRQCPSCGHFLEDINLSEEEYINVKEKIKRDVIEGTDVFRNTSPQELERFQRFMNEYPPFDVVIDGLNVAKTTLRNPSSKTLLDVVFYLAQKYDRLLVLGRRHMLKHSFQWKKSDMDAMQKKADFFFTDNMSKDDPFLLYATFHSGGHCMIVTRDLLRDHKAVLSDSVTRRLFFKWQRGHQMVVSSYVPGKILTFEDALPYDTIVQTDGNTWHIPYDDNLSDRASLKFQESGSVFRRNKRCFFVQSENVCMAPLFQINFNKQVKMYSFSKTTDLDLNESLRYKQYLILQILKIVMQLFFIIDKCNYGLNQLLFGWLMDCIFIFLCFSSVTIFLMFLLSRWASWYHIAHLMRNNYVCFRILLFMCSKILSVVGCDKLC